MSRYTQAFELSTNLAMFYTRCYMLAHLTRNDKHKDCALAYNKRINQYLQKYKPLISLRFNYGKRLNIK